MNLLFRIACASHKACLSCIPLVSCVRSCRSHRFTLGVAVSLQVTQTERRQAEATARQTHELQRLHARAEELRQQVLDAP